MIQKRRGLIENDDIHVIALQQRNEFGRQLRRIAKLGIRQAIAFDANRDVDVAVRLPALAGLGAEKVSLEDLRPPVEISPQALDASLLVRGHVSSIGPAGPESNNPRPWWDSCSRRPVSMVAWPEPWEPYFT